MKLPLGSEPIRTLLIPLVLGAFVAAAQAFIAGADTRGIIIAALGALILAAQELGRKLVTPVPVPVPAGEGGGALLGVLLALVLAVVVYFVAVALGLPFVLCLVLGLIGAVAGWLIGAPRPEL